MKHFFSENRNDVVVIIVNEICVGVKGLVGAAGGGFGAAMGRGCCSVMAQGGGGPHARVPHDPSWMRWDSS